MLATRANPRTRRRQMRLPAGYRLSHSLARYAVLRYIGWNRPRRIHDCLLHVDLKGDKVWIQHDGLGEGIASDLMEAGVPGEHIVLAWHTERERRMMVTFAVN